MAERDSMERRVYVLPKEQMDRIRAYQARNSISSEVEAVRRLLETALQMKDSVRDILDKMKSRFAEERDLRVLARDILAGHVLVREVHFDDNAIAFCLSGEDYGRMDSQGRIFQGTNWEDWSEIGKAPPPRRAGSGGGPNWDTPKGGDLDDEIPF